MQKIPTVVFGVAAAAVILVLSAPLLRAAGAVGPADLVYALFGLVCHQSPERSLHLFGHGFAVCGRCAGLYAGLLVALALVRAADRDRGRWLPGIVLLAAPVAIAVDIGLAVLGLHEPTLVTRALSGLALGAGLALVFAHARSSAPGLQLAALVLLAVPLVACKAREKPLKKDAPPAQAAPKAPARVVAPSGCTRDTDCKGNRVCADGACVDREVPVIVEVAPGCARDIDCKGNRVCVDGRCREPAVPRTRVVEVVPSTRCDDCPGTCLAIKQRCNGGSVKDCFLAGACMCECKLAAGGCGSTPDELRSCISTNRAKARE